MPDKNFLEEYPLYRKFDYTVEISNPIPAINYKCDECGTTQTFLPNKDHYDRDKSLSVLMAQIGRIQKAAGESEELQESDFIESLIYICASCEKYQLFFFLHFCPTQNYVEKIGQLPSWSIEIDSELEKALGSSKVLFKKGLICESQSYGIGAFTYYRRIIESVIDKLLEELAELISDQDRDSYLEALKQVKKSKVAKDKIEVVKEMMPGSLRPGGSNPLGLIHDSLSKGIHVETDEECLRYAATIRVALTYLVDQIYRSKDERTKFSESISQLLDKKSGKKD